MQSNNDDKFRMRVQLQHSRAGNTETHSKTAIAPAGIGVTVRQLQATLRILWDTTKDEAGLWYPFYHYEEEYANAIISLSKRLNSYPFEGIDGSFNIDRRLWPDTKIGPFRLDIETLRGHNLRIKGRKKAWIITPEGTEHFGEE